MRSAVPPWLSMRSASTACGTSSPNSITLSTVWVTPMMISDAARGAGHEDRPARPRDDHRGHRRARPLARRGLVRRAGRPEVRELVVEQEARPRRGHRAAELLLDGAGQGDRVAAAVDDRHVRRRAGLRDVAGPVRGGALQRDLAAAPVGVGLRRQLPPGLAHERPGRRGTRSRSAHAMRCASAIRCSASADPSPRARRSSGSSRLSIWTSATPPEVGGPIEKTRWPR